jgi:hypothetical protein
MGQKNLFSSKTKEKSERIIMVDEEKKEEELEDADKASEEDDSKKDESSDKKGSEETPEEELNRLRSLDGRVQPLQSKLQTLENTLESFMEFMKEEKGKSSKEEDDLDDDFVPTTKEELNAWAEERDRKKDEERKQYEDRYRAQLKTFSKEENFEDIYDEMMANHNVRHSDDGIADAKVNFLNAKVTFLESKAKEKKSPLDKNRDKEAEHLGGGLESENMGGKAPSAVKLDPEAVEYMKSRGMSEEKAREILSKEAPLELTETKTDG